MKASTNEAEGHPCPYTIVDREIAQVGVTKSLSDNPKNIKLGKAPRIDQEQKHRALMKKYMKKNKR